MTRPNLKDVSKAESQPRPTTPPPPRADPPAALLVAPHLGQSRTPNPIEARQNVPRGELWLPPAALEGENEKAPVSFKAQRGLGPGIH